MKPRPDPLAELEAFPFPPPDSGILTVDEPVEALLALLLSTWARRTGGELLHVARSETRADRLARAAASFAPDLEVMLLPPWDCSPYDRTSPSPAIMGIRMATLERLLVEDPGPGRLVIATVGSLLQRVPPRSSLRHARFELAPARAVDDLRLWLIGSGYVLDERVDEPGEAAFRGEVIEIFPSAGSGPVRIEHADGSIRRMRCYDPVDQRTTSEVDRLVLHPASEVLLEEVAVRAFLAGDDDAVRAGVLVGKPERPRRASGIEHRLPVFYERLEAVFDYLPGALVSLDPGVEERVADWLTEITDAFETRSTVERNGEGGKPAALEPRLLCLEGAEWRERLAGRAVLAFTAVNGSDPSHALPAFDTADPGLEVARFVEARAEDDGCIVLAAHDRTARQRFARLVERHTTGIAIGRLERWDEMAVLPGGTVVVADLDLRGGFVLDRLTVIAAEQAGVQPGIPRGGMRMPEAFPVDNEELRTGDLVVHAAHGIARLCGLELQGGDEGAPVDEYLSLEFAGERKLLVPALEIEQLWRYGAEAAEVPLDRLGGDVWQARRVEVEAQLEAAARDLLARTRQRAATSGPQLRPARAAYRRFVARFPFSETEDQTRAIDAVLRDLARGAPPMDRLICGDVGFGKTEVALRAACAAALAGRQVAVVAPTTVLVRQHLETFRRRFAGFDVRVEQLSRLSGGAEARAVRAGLADGSVGIAVGTHSLASDKVRFADLGLVIVDEEQRFGARHKEQLRRLRDGVHVLTLSATPIPRTLQAALVGLIDISVIAVPPVRRRPVRTFVTPSDPATVREALRREARRGGQSFFVCPRIQDLQPVAERLGRLVPELDVALAHGRMKGAVLDEIMVGFAAGAHDVLLTTDIIEAGLDIPNANTMMVWRADRFGLAQLHQLRGRVGRGARQAASYLLTDPDAPLAPATEQRLRTLEALEGLGAGFAVGTRDLDLRGAGDLLGADQAGHVRLIGTGLYQRLLADALARVGGAAPRDHRSPELHLALAALVPSDYVPEPDVRIGLYRRLSSVADESSAVELAEEIADRFGPPPDAVRQLIEVSRLRARCRAAGITRLEVGPKGIAAEFHDPEAVRKRLASGSGLHWRDDRLICTDSPTGTAEERLQAAHELLSRLPRCRG